MDGGTELEFIDIVAEILKQNRFEITHEPLVGSSNYRLRPDLLAKFQNRQFVIEIKHYRTPLARTTYIQRALNQVEHYLSEFSTNSRSDPAYGLLIVSSYLVYDMKKELETQTGISIVDIADLALWAAKSPQLLSRLLDFVENPLESTYQAQGRTIEAVLENLTSRDVQLSAIPLANEGALLCEKLGNIPTGRDNWRDHERICEEILKYLFSDDLTGWDSQKRTDDGLNRFDLVCRIKSGSEFWRFIIEHINSRYVLFEFKNYSRAIKQGQVLTTEKYLLEKGLRKFGLILSRSGFHESAAKTAQGSMREDGKLILSVDDELLCKMLAKKDDAGDPSDLLFELADDFLLKLSR